MSSLLRGITGRDKKAKDVQELPDELNINRIGFSEIYCAEDPKVDIILVHGLGGQPKRTWTGANGVYWPKQLLPDGVDHIRVLSYGYDADPAFFSSKASGDNVMDHAHTLIAHLHALRNSKVRGI
jgi:hypothetical protein